MSANLSIINTSATASAHPSDIQLAWLKRGLNQPGGKLPLFD